MVLSRRTDAEYVAAVHVLTAPILAARTPGYITPDGIRFDRLLEASRSWSHGEQLLVDVALDLWNGDGKSTPMDLIRSLDDGNFDRVLEAIALRRGTRP
jgi:hypothetical protein